MTVTDSHTDNSALEVARRAKVSLSTVSRVFRGKTNVSESTRRRVVNAARAVGYQPNVAARALRTGRPMAIGFVLTNHHVLRGQFWADALAGFESIFAEQGLRVVVAVPSPGIETHSCVRDLLGSGHCAGLVVQGDEIHENDVAALREIDGVVALMNYRSRQNESPLGLSAVGFDNLEGSAQAVRHLLALGHRRIAFIGGTPTTRDAVRREEGFRSAMADIGLPINEEWVLAGDFGRGEGGFGSGMLQMDHILAEGADGPTGVICASDEIAVGAMESIRRCGKRVPDDLSLIGFDNHSWSAHLDTPLTTVAHSGWDLGVTMANRLMTQMDKPDAEPCAEVLRTRLIIRDSTGKPRDTD